MGDNKEDNTNGNKVRRYNLSEESYQAIKHDEALLVGNGDILVYMIKIIKNILKSEESKDFRIKLNLAVFVHKRLEELFKEIFEKDTKQSADAKDNDIKCIYDRVLNKCTEYEKDAIKDMGVTLKKCRKYRNRLHSPASKRPIDDKAIKSLFRAVIKNFTEFEKEKFLESPEQIVVNALEAHHKSISEWQKEEYEKCVVNILLFFVIGYAPNKMDEILGPECCAELANCQQKLENNTNAIEINDDWYNDVKQKLKESKLRGLYQELREAFGLEETEETESPLDSIKRKLCEESYSTWVKKLFSLKSDKEVTTRQFSIDNLSKEDLSDEEQKVFQNNYGQFIRALLEYYGHLRFYQRERIFLLDQYSSIAELEKNDSKKNDSEKSYLVYTINGLDISLPRIIVSNRADDNHVVYVSFPEKEIKITQIPLRKIGIGQQDGISTHITSRSQNIIKDSNVKHIKNMIMTKLEERDVMDVDNTDKVRVWKVKVKGYEADKNDEYLDKVKFVKDRFDKDFIVRPKVYYPNANEKEEQGVYYFKDLKINVEKYFAFILAPENYTKYVEIIKM